LAGSNFKQFIRIVQNKMPLNAGLLRKSVQRGQGYLGDLHNFELDEDIARLRLGTRVVGLMEDASWYDVKSFKISDTEIILGLNYKRELWGWLDKWAETNFKICNTSPFRKYNHTNISGVKFEDSHFSFDKGNKFWFEEDDFSILIMNDYGEIFRIMKRGHFRITGDAEASYDTAIEESLHRQAGYILILKKLRTRCFTLLCLSAMKQ